jgi:hypothetical protein
VSNLTKNKFPEQHERLSIPEDSPADLHVDADLNLTAEGT